MEFIFELLAEVFAEFILGTLLEVVCTHTGAFFLWLFYGLKFDFAHYLYKKDGKKDEKKVGKAFQVGCFFYVIIFFVLLIFHVY